MQNQSVTFSNLSSTPELEMGMLFSLALWNPVGTHNSWEALMHGVSAEKYLGRGGPM